MSVLMHGVFELAVDANNATGRPVRITPSRSIAATICESRFARALWSRCHIDGSLLHGAVRMIKRNGVSPGRATPYDSVREDPR